MNHYRKHGPVIFLLLLITSFLRCTSPNETKASFVVLDSKLTGLNFINRLTSTDSFNLFKYMYFYNGAGLGAGDFNNDGLIDLFFASNQGDNSLYLNRGSLQFTDVTAEAGVSGNNGWSTGVSVVDINNDGLLDIYVCRVGKYEILKSKNQLLICQGISKKGIPFYSDRAHEYGLDFSGFSTQAAFFDFDLDGDLDMFLLNHSVHENTNFRPRIEYLGTYSELSGDRIFRNDGRRFTDITRQSGINSNAISYGLGVVVSDINLDGYPDLYVGNDFHENDYLYINQKNGTFRDELNERMMHTSKFSMGVDAADINNDGNPEVISVDMLPSDPYILKRSLGENEYDIFNLKINYGYNYQYSRNNLQYNRKNGMFSETGLYSGIAATDWSWAPLWVDFDNDGLKDLFISNGIPKRMNDIDYINFISDQEIQQKIQDKKLKATDATLIDKFPDTKLTNKFFSNRGNLLFSDLKQQVRDEKTSYSNGAVYADFDNDGDLDIVVNNIDEPALLYQNKNNDSGQNRSIQIKLKGPDENLSAIGSKVVLFGNDEVRLYEKFPVHGFLSSMEIPLHLGVSKTRIDSAFLIWPDNTYQPIGLLSATSNITFAYEKKLPLFDYRKITQFHKAGVFALTDFTKEADLNYRHVENAFPEFDREPLIPGMFSTEGPALAVADINHDGLDDLFFGSSKGSKSAVFLQVPGGKFTKCDVPVLDNDSTWEDVDACWTDVNNDGNTDLVVAPGGNEFYGQEPYLSPRIYLNDGKAHFSVLANAFSQLYVNASSVAPGDFNGDGFQDLFIAGRTVPWNYGQPPHSYLLQSDKTGKFKDVTMQYAKELANAGFVTKGVWVDLDKDADPDLIVSLEWGGIDAYINEKGNFRKQQLTNRKGWWNFVLPCDIDKDGDIDLVAGNLGLNTRFHQADKDEVKLYFNDFDDNGKKEQLVTYHVGGKEIPFANKAELEKQMPFLKKKFLYAKDFASASLPDIFTGQKLEDVQPLTADYFSNSILINNGKSDFTLVPMPWQAQLTSYSDAAIVDANGDDLPDLFLVGNFYENNVEMGRYDADFGTVLINLGNGKFKCETAGGLTIKGQSRHIKKIIVDKKEGLIIARNNDSALLVRFQQQK